MPLDKSWADVVRTIVACQCASISPGISTRPPPAMIWVSARRSVGIGPVEILSMMLPLIRTLDGAESEGCLPSNMRTFSITVTAERSCASAGTTQMEAAATAPDASPSRVRRIGVLMFFSSARNIALSGYCRTFGLWDTCRCRKPALQANDALMTALGQERTSAHLRPMSALPPKADIAECDPHVRFVPKADIAIYSIIASASSQRIGTLILSALAVFMLMTSRTHGCSGPEADNACGLATNIRSNFSEEPPEHAVLKWHRKYGDNNREYANPDAQGHGPQFSPSIKFRQVPICLSNTPIALDWIAAVIGSPVAGVTLVSNFLRPTF